MFSKPVKHSGWIGVPTQFKKEGTQSVCVKFLPCSLGINASIRKREGRAKGERAKGERAACFIHTKQARARTESSVKGDIVQRHAAYFSRSVLFLHPACCGRRASPPNPHLSPHNLPKHSVCFFTKKGETDTKPWPAPIPCLDRGGGGG